MIRERHNTLPLLSFLRRRLFQVGIPTRDLHHFNQKGSDGGLETPAPVAGFIWSGCQNAEKRVTFSVTLFAHFDNIFRYKLYIRTQLYRISQYNTFL